MDGTTVDGTGHGTEPARPGDPPRRSLVGEFRDGITVRAAVLVLGVAGLQLGFIASYVGAFHQPRPHRVPVAVVVPADLAVRVVDGLDGLPGDPLQARAVTTAAAGRADLLARTVAGVLVVATSGSTDRLEVAGAAGVAEATAVAEVLRLVEAREHRSLHVVDVRPPLPGDENSLTSFYLVVGWIVGGYLVASLLGVSAGSRPANVNRATVRLSAIAAYSVATGLGGALLVGPVFHALPDHLLGLWALGALVVFSAGAFSTGLQVLAGTVGIGLTVLLFVILGNPSAGGAYGWPLLPWFWRTIGPWLPSGAGTQAARAIGYFGGTGIGGELLVIAAYAVAGLALTYGVLLNVGHQLVHLPRAARRPDERADDPADGPD